MQLIRAATSMRSAHSASYVEERDGISHDWTLYLEQKGVLPVLVPNVSRDPKLYAELTGCTALLLTGGDDLDEPSRLKTEKELIEWAISNDFPIFGVCRGLQVINHYFGGRIRHCSETIHVGNFHKVSILPPIDNQTGISESRVNSFHNHCVHQDDLAKGIVPFAVTDQGIVEGIYVPSKKIAAIQWHPEREDIETPISKWMIEQWLKTRIW